LRLKSHYTLLGDFCNIDYKGTALIISFLSRKCGGVRKILGIGKKAQLLELLMKTLNSVD
jgi:hypothetical protein